MSIRIFLADDHTVIRDGLRLLLESKADIKVVGEAENGLQAVSMICRLIPDIVLMDIAMPELNGIAAIEKIQAADPSMKIIVLSVFATKEHIFRSFKAGTKGYLVKTSAGQEVLEAIKSVLAGHRYLSRTITDTVIEDYIQHREASLYKSPLEKLSPREKEILQHVVEGKTSNEISKRIHLSPKTIDSYRSRIMQKLDLKDLPSLIKFAIQNGLTSLD